MSVSFPVKAVSESLSQPLVSRFFDNLSRINAISVLGGDAATTIDSTQLWALAQGYRAVLRARGLERGAVVAIGLPTCMTVLASLLAAWAEGMVITLLPYNVADHSGRLSPSKLAQMLELVSPDCLLLDASMVAYVPQALQAKVLGLDDFQKLARELAPVTEAPVAAPSDTAIFQFTSGSTGVPKAAVITQAMLSANCAAIAERVMVGSGDKMVSWLPMHHDMGLSAVTLAWWAGIDLVMRRRRCSCVSP